MSEQARKLIEAAPKGSVINKMTEQQVEELLHKATQADKQAERTKLYGARKRVHDSLLIVKAKKAGITVSKEEVEREMKVRGLTK